MVDTVKFYIVKSLFNTSFLQSIANRLSDDKVNKVKKKKEQR